MHRSVVRMWKWRGDEDGYALTRCLGTRDGETAVRLGVLSLATDDQCSQSSREIGRTGRLARLYVLGLVASIVGRLDPTAVVVVDTVGIAGAARSSFHAIDQILLLALDARRGGESIDKVNRDQQRSKIIELTVEAVVAEGEWSRDEAAELAEYEANEELQLMSQ
ncbi:hypothetical protein PRIPAC_70508 [Pristionchus pacificus]|uniref:Uncharacterized protein n=1 Tax=Pristionchus pacificus TaxID=54126 RepID=A0A2A6CFH4_PRIPA|nr:hypothetical protein PRIPAC_70508 [Pristionchus pacificus]|eukprot:PDM76838.1 hypothetical protein PRIPAC_42233 [Pristionchus pacificus]